MKDYIETQYKNLDFTIPDDYVSRRESTRLVRTGTDGSKLLEKR